MQELSYIDFRNQVRNAISLSYPLYGNIELTYRCNLNCVHCYCKGSEDKSKELTSSQWKKILNEIHKEGCLWLTLTGGEPLLRSDFSEIYTYAYKKGFLVNVFTNGTLLSKEILKLFEEKPPYSIEISLYGSTKEVYESITGVSGYFQIVIENIHKLLQLKLPLVLKTVGLKQNKQEILKIKKLAENLLGKNKFKFDSFITARINGDTEPCKYRLSPEEIVDIESADPDMINQRKEQLHMPYGLKRSKEFLYQCNSWQTSFFINPYGLLQFCNLTKKFSVYLNKKSFKDGFYKEFPKLLNEKFITSSNCKFCNLREICYFCPARVYLETKNIESPVEYYCQLAKARDKQRKLLIEETSGYERIKL
jgi:radical SAM protein with 4Fe4S-binding SPASM domain